MYNGQAHYTRHYENPAGRAPLGNQLVAQLPSRKTQARKGKCCKFNWRRYFNWIVFCICFVIGSWQSSVIAGLFLAFPVRIDIEIARPENLTLPAVSICISFYPLKNEHMDKIDPNFKMPESIPEEYEYINDAITVEQYDSITPDFETMIESCKIFNPNISKHVDCSTMSKVRTHLNSRFKCFTWFERVSMIEKMENGSGVVSEYQTDDLLGSDWVNIKVRNLSLVKDLVGISVFSADDQVQPDLGNPSYLEVIRFWYKEASIQKASVTYSSSRSLLRGAPYGKCKDYRDYYHEFSKKAAIENCTLRAFLMKYKKWPADIMAYDLWDKQWKIPFAPNTSRQYAHEEREECNKQYQEQDCIEINYSLSLKSVEYGSLLTLEVALYAPSGNEIHLQQMPRYELIEVLSYVAGIVSLWIGISVVSIVTPMIPKMLARWDNFKYKHCGGPMPQPLPVTRPQVAQMPDMQQFKNNARFRAAVIDKPPQSDKNSVLSLNQRNQQNMNHNLQQYSQQVQIQKKAATNFNTNYGGAQITREDSSNPQNQGYNYNQNRGFQGFN